MDIFYFNGEPHQIGMKIFWVGATILAAHGAVISWIDFKTYTIPNWINTSLLVCGAYVAWAHLHHQLPDVGFRVATVYLVFSSLVFLLNKKIGKASLGGGDIKLFSAAAAWYPIELIPWLVLTACFLGLLFIIVVARHKQQSIVDKKIAFGPFISIALVTTWLLQSTLSNQVNFEFGGTMP